MSKRYNLPTPFISRSALEFKTRGMRNSEPPPLTYKSYKQIDGKEVFVGEFPTPLVFIKDKKNGH